MLCTKSYKIKKNSPYTALEKNSQQPWSYSGSGCEFFFTKRYKGHHRCLLLLPRLLGVGRLAAVTVNTDHGPTDYGVGVSHCSAADLYRLRDACLG